MSSGRIAEEDDGESSLEGFQGLGEPVCPFFKKACADWLYPVTGYCRGRLDGKLIIPSIAEYREFCTTEHYRSCGYCSKG